MTQDSIVDEVRRIRETYAKRHNYDLEAICRDLKDKEKQSRRRHVSFAPKRAKPAGRLTR